MKIKDISVTALFSAVICIAAVITVPIGTVPITLALFGVFTAAALLKPNCAISAVLVYIMLGTVGLPVFSGFGSGVGFLFGPTGGFIFAYPIAALIISLSGYYFKKHRAALPIAMIFAICVCYFFGSIWYCFIAKTSFTAAISVCVLPFILFDAVKIAASLTVVLAIKKSPIKNLI